MGPATWFKKKFRARREESRQTSYERKHDILYKRKGGEKVLFIVMGVIFVVFAITFIFPFLWILMNSFKGKLEFAMDFMGWPVAWNWSNFAKAVTFQSAETHNYTVFQMMGMSLLVAGGGTLATVITSSCAAYVVAKYKFPGRGLIFSVVIFSMIIPIVGSLPSQIQLMRAMGLDNTVIGLIFLYSGGFGSNFLLLYGFFKNLSWTYVEAAKIDGASDFRIFLQIILPMAKGPITAVGILSLIGLWNDYFNPSIFLSKQPTIAVGIYYMQNAMLETKGNYPMFFATVIITLIPILLVFLCFSKTIMENTSVGGLKG
ncbi:MAG: carbohydrate ABC transporter permease [Bacilli bacterium]|jgi:raffinose/stachyose/melibiose transport system permease protein/N-acetylglucosamine transport system permease protein|nr:carbohydrate ABC transporter permease [Bacilli bacterium]